MNVNPSAGSGINAASGTSAAASVAGTARAAARGGESDGKAIESTRQQSTAEKPGGKSNQTSEVEAGEQSGDRGANGQQVLDQFELSDKQEDEPQESPPPPSQSVSQEGCGKHLDLEA